MYLNMSGYESRGEDFLSEAAYQLRMDRIELNLSSAPAIIVRSTISIIVLCYITLSNGLHIYCI